eukprot:PhM_4_TR11337/c0_g1_i1/m.103951/K00485/FMO; dimethylaniline monooxygenase (N-oxide forming)
MNHIAVCIIGAGPGGLAAAKSLMDCGENNFIILEAQSTVGGVWRDDGTGKTWPGMITNLSREKCRFSDLDHDDGVPDFPTATQMYEYLRRYADTFDLTKKIRFNTTVTSVVRDSTDVESNSTYPYNVKAASACGETTTTEFRAQFVVVATGVFAQPFLPDDLVVQCREAAVPYYHSQGLDLSQFRGPHHHVLVVGAAYSGADMAVALSSQGARVTTLVRSPRYYLPRLIDNKNRGEGDEKVPWDRLWECRTASGDTAKYNSAVEHSKKHAFLSAHLRPGGEAHPLLAVNPDVDAAQTIVTDNFLDYVSDGKINVVKSEGSGGISDLLRRREDGITSVVFATGYRCDLSFLDDHILGPCEPDFTTDFLPLILYKSTLHPTMPDIGFVGIYRGPYMATLEVQARWVAALACKKVRRPSNTKLSEMLEEERFLRSHGGASREEVAATGVGTRRRQAFPHSHYISFTDCLAEEFGARPTTVRFPALAGQNAVAGHYRLESVFSEQAPIGNPYQIKNPD